MGIADHMRPSPKARPKESDPESRFSKEETELSRKIKSIYTAQRSAYDYRMKGIKTRWRSNRRYDDGVKATVETKEVLPVWITLARFFRENEITPYDYINYHFQNATLNRAPEPFQLKTPALLNDYQVWRKKEINSLRISFRTQKSIAVTNIRIQRSYDPELSDSDVYGLVLTDESIELSALFRYCLAKSLRLKKIASIYLHRAAMQFYCNPVGYIKVWKRWLPKGFKVKASKLFKFMVGETDA